MKPKKMKVINKSKSNKGFSLIELVVAMAITLTLMGVATSLFAGALRTRTRESRRVDALTSARAALSAISREIGNSGYGIRGNGVVAADSSAQKLRFRANLSNDDYSADSPGEDVTYFFDATTQSIVRYDPNSTPETSVIVNRISNVSFSYFDYVGNNSTPTTSTTPSGNTGRVRITVTVKLEDVIGQPKNQTVAFTSDVTLRNSPYMLNQY